MGLTAPPSGHASGPIRSALFLVGWMLSFTPCALAASTSLTLAVTDLQASAPVLIAEAKGFFLDEGLALKVIHCPVGRICLQQLFDGKAQIATVADVPIATASLTRKGFAIVATITSSGRENRLIVRQDRGIRSAADLKGKRIGTFVGTTGQYFTESVLLYSGLAVSDVTIVPLDPSDGIGPLQRGEIDAAGFFEPYGREALRRLGSQARTLPMPEIISTTFNLVSVPSAAGASDDDLLKVLRAVQRANQLIRDKPEQARKIVAAALKIDPLTLAESWDDYDFRLQLGQPLVTTLEAQARWAMRGRPGGDRAQIPDFLEFIRSEPLRRLDARAVRLVQ